VFARVRLVAAHPQGLFWRRGFLQMAQTAQAELFWIFLDDFYPLEALKELNLTGFDWSSRHENGQTILARHICNTLVQPAEKFADGLNS
jgi:hypothetical protein